MVADQQNTITGSGVLIKMTLKKSLGFQGGVLLENQLGGILIKSGVLYAQIRQFLNKGPSRVAFSDSSTSYL